MVLVLVRESCSRNIPKPSQVYKEYVYMCMQISIHNYTDIDCIVSLSISDYHIYITHIQYVPGTQDDPCLAHRGSFWRSITQEMKEQLGSNTNNNNNTSFSSLFGALHTSRHGLHSVWDLGMISRKKKGSLCTSECRQKISLVE